MMLKRMLCLVLAAVMTAALAACTDPASDGTEQTAAPATAAATTVTEAPVNTADEPQTDDPTQPEMKGMDLTAFIRTFDRTAQTMEQVIYETDNITVTAVGLRYDPIKGPAVNFRVDNRSARALLIQADTCAVNGYMTAAQLSFTAPAGKKTEGEMFIPYASLALAGANVIMTVEVTLVLVDPDTLAVLHTCEPAVVRTTAAAAYEEYVPVYDEEGQKVYDAGDIRIVLKGIDRARQISEYPALVVYMFNGSDRAVCVQSKSLLINGYEMTCVMSTTVMPGRGAVDVVEIFDMDLKEHDIDQIETAEISFRIVDENTWETIAETGTVLVEEESAE